MDLLNNILYGFSVSLEPTNLFSVFFGVLIGTLVGVLPGLGPVAAMSLLLPITFKMSTVSSIIMLAGIFYGAMYGGSTTSILVNIPGEAASIVTCLDGYQMARNGRAGPALGISAFGSFIAGTFSVIGIILLTPIMVSFALKFGPPEFFGLLFLGLTMVTYLSGGSRIKAYIMALLGLILGTVGLDPIVGTPRFTYGVVTLMDGIGLTPIVMGLFGIAEVLINIEQTLKRDISQTRIKGLLPNKQDWKDSAMPIARGSLLGFILGILPGIGAIIPTFLSYALEKKISRHPEKFGKGAIEGVAGPESANNAAVGGGLIPLLALGIPPNVVMALLLGALMIHGVQPGPLFIKENPEIFWGVITSLYTGNIMLLILNLPLIGIWVKILKIPYLILFPLILLFSLIGVYSINSNIVEIFIMIIFGIIGYFMRKFEYEAAPLVLSFVLGRMVEESLRQSLILSKGSFIIFFIRPISAIFLFIALFMILLPILKITRSSEYPKAIYEKTD